jgi:hypothetical protein
MKQILVEIDDRCARDLERVAPTRRRKRAEFIRLAIRRAIDLALERDTIAAYRSHPISDELLAGDLDGWDPENELARPAAMESSRRRRSKRSAS